MREWAPCWVGYPHQTTSCTLVMVPPIISLRSCSSQMCKSNNNNLPTLDMARMLCARRERGKGRKGERREKGAKGKGGEYVYVFCASIYIRIRMTLCLMFRHWVGGNFQIWIGRHGSHCTRWTGSSYHNDGLVRIIIISFVSSF